MAIPKTTRRGCAAGIGLALAVIAILASSALSQQHTKPRRPIVSDQPLTHTGTMTPRDCLNWASGPAALICNPAELRQSLARHRERLPSPLRVETPGNHGGRIGGFPGLVQVLLFNGWPFEPGGKLVIQGVAKRGTFLLINARDRSHGERHLGIGQALFRDLGLTHGGTTTLTVGMGAIGLTYKLRRPDGRVVGPDAIWFKRG